MFTMIQGNTWMLALSGLFIIGVLVVSSDVAVKKFTGLSAYFKLSTTFMGATVLSLATSIPEISAHLTASVGILRRTLDYQISSAVVLGSNIGSDVVQQTLIMSLVVFIAGVLRFKRYFLWKVMGPMIGTTIMCLVLGWDRHYSRLDGAILFGTFIAYIYYLYLDERKHYEPHKNGFSETGEPPKGVPVTRWEALRDSLIALVAMVFTIGSAMTALQIAEVIVQRTGIGGSLIGVTTLGVASALPELITAVSGIRNGDHGIPLGTLVGSNITNPLVAIGLGSLVSTYWVPGPLVLWDLPWETITGLILWAIIWFNKGKLGRWAGFYLIALYIVYVLLRSLFFAVD